jgi:ketosteroid isomerase-like protein
VTQTATLGSEFAQALAAKDFDRVAALFAPDVEFRALTPRRYWEPGGPEEIVSGVLREWFKDSDEIEAVEKVETDLVADRERVAYRFRVRRDGELFLVEQQAYLSQRDGRIAWMRVLCTGYRPIEQARARSAELQSTD